MFKVSIAYSNLKEPKNEILLHGSKVFTAIKFDFFLPEALSIISTAHPEGKFLKIYCFEANQPVMQYIGQSPDDAEENTGQRGMCIATSDIYHKEVYVATN